MHIAYFPNAWARNATPVMEAMISALTARGHVMVANSMMADAAVIWSQLWAGRMRANQAVFEHYRGLGRTVVVMEVGCLRRGQLWRVTANGAVTLRDHGGGRSHALGVSLAPWRQVRGGNIMLCLQRSDSQQWQGQPRVETWMQHTVDHIRQHSDRPIVVRPHPRQRVCWVPPGCTLEAPRPVPGSYDCVDFESALSQAWAVVNVNSYPGVQSTINGVPAFVNATSVAAPVANTDLAMIEDPVMPDREQWFEQLCWTEFSVPEIQGGLPLDVLALP